MADQARLEDSRGAATSCAVLEATSAIIRIAYRFEMIARGRLSGPQTLPDNVSQSMADIEEAIYAALNSVAGKLGPPSQSEQLEPRSEAPLESVPNLKAFIGERAEDVMEESGAWPPSMRSFLLKQLATYDRLEILFSNLDVHISKLAGS